MLRCQNDRFLTKTAYLCVPEISGRHLIKYFSAAKIVL